jgi:hypothetical protein
VSTSPANATVTREPGRIGRAMRGPWPIHPLLLGAYFVLFLLSQNLGEVTFVEAAPWVLAAAVGAAIVTLITALVFGDAARGGIVAAAIVVCFFAYGHVADALSPLRIPIVVYPVGWVVLLVGATLLAIRVRERLPSITRALNVLAILLVAVSLVTIVPYELNRKPVQGPGHQLVVTPAGGTVRKPDIYYIILDRHAGDATLQAAFHIQSSFTTHLRSDGFVVLDHAYANYMRTHLSLASSLNMTYLDDLTDRYGRATNDSRPVFELLQDHAVGRFLQQAGYRYIHTGSAYGPTDRNRIADLNPRRTNDSDFSRALFDTTVLPGIVRRLTNNGRPPTRDRLYETARWQWGELADVRDMPGPKFVFSHFLLPHPPYIFDTDGSYVDEATEKARGEAESYRRQLAYTDGQVERFLEPLLRLPDAERPIIIIQADEGPFPKRYQKEGLSFDWTTSTSAEIEQKFGILDAMLLPGNGPVPYHALTPVNTFRFVFDRYFGANLPMLPDRVYMSSTGGNEYDFIEITDRLVWGPELRAGQSAGALPP